MGPQHPSVLVVDDDDDVREIVAEVIQDEGVEVLEAASAQEALELLSNPETRFDLIVTDIRMPGMDGLEMAKAIEEKWPGTQVLFMTGFAGELLADRRPPLSREHLLRKPFTLVELTERVHDLLGPHEHPTVH